MTHTSFTDEPHVDQIAQALWARESAGSAALLVGAGFSRNATSLRPAAGAMPGWNDIYATMVDQLYPVSPNAAGDCADTRLNPRDWLLQQTGATSAYLRVAEEFEAQYGRDALDKLILRHVPDKQFGPGRLHEMLVELPWADIMTTNWDTLLERAAEKAEERVYDVVRTVEEIPVARAPRVIKLHGSFPANLPFVFTEEDFRTYPVRAGAFVNLAQQLAMENTLVLLGFSGDDPNFLFWSGWVRDRLGPKAPLIYLVGVLGLTAPKRKMLEARRIQPIDLAQLPMLGTWPEGQRMANAHQWFLERLRAAEPYPQRRWPRAATGFVPPLQFVTPIADLLAPLPDPEGDGHSSAVDTLRRLVVQWRQNRLVYPGWIVPPLGTSESLWHRIDRHLGEFIQGLSELTDEERLEALYELNWQQEAALVPLILTVDDHIVALLDILLPRYAQLPAEPARQYRALALAIVRHAREENEADLFARWTQWLEPHLADDVDGRDRLRYEHCLYRRAELDVDGLEALLKDWGSEADSFWALRKAALLADLGRDAEASELSAQTLLTIRAQTLRGTKDLAFWSRESFAMLFRTSVMHGEIGQWLENKPVRDRFDLRQEQLQANGCPGRRDFFELVERLKQTPPPLRQPEEQTRKFDLGAVNRMMRFGSVDPRVDRLLAYQALRFVEESGLPVRIGATGITGQILIQASAWLMDVAPTRALDALLHALPGGTGKDIEKLLTRTSVARIAPAEAERLMDRVTRLMAAAAARVENSSGDTRFWVERLRSVTEIASRIVLRLPSRAPVLLQAALELHRSPRLSRQVYLADGLRHLLKRCMEAAEPEHRDSMLLALFREPLVKDPSQSAHDRIDAAADLSKDLWVAVPGPEWGTVVEEAISGLTNPETRWTASRRISWLWNAKLVDEAQHHALAQALWSAAHLKDGYPDGTGFFPSAFLSFPVPEGTDPRPGIVWTVLDDTPLTDAIVSDGARVAMIQNQSVTIDEACLCAEIERLHTFVADHPPAPPFRDLFGNSEADLVEETARYAAALALRAGKVPAALEPLKRLIAAARYPLRLEPAMPALANLGLVPPAEAVAAMQRILRQKEDDAALVTVLLNQFAWGVPCDQSVESALWPELAHVVVERRAPVLFGTLHFVAHMMQREPARVPAEHDELLSLGLGLILADTDMTKPNENAGYDPYLIRFFAAALVTAMDAAGRGDPAVRKDWADAIEADPLPDTRRAREISRRRLESDISP